MAETNSSKKNKKGSKPVVLSIAGSDSAGLAGQQMDVRSLTAMGVHPACVVTAVTAQNNQRCLSVNPVTEAVLVDQLEAVSAVPLAAVKIGLLSSEGQLKQVKKYLEDWSVPVVYDPVLSSSSGFEFADEKFITALKQWLSCCDLVTPNLQEAAQLSGREIKTPDDIEAAAQDILDLGAKAVLIKGGHSDDPQFSQDYFCRRRNNSSEGNENSLEKKAFWLSSPRIDTDNSRGTGCALSSSVAAALACQYSLADAVVIGKMAINQGFREAYSLQAGEGKEPIKGPVAIDRFPDQQIDLPILTQQPALPETKPFPTCTDQQALGLYPVVDRARWLERLLPLGVTTIQLRIKDLQGEALKAEFSQGIALAEKYGCRLFINDYWQLAIELGAYGVHLGQEDLDSADIDAIRQAGLRLGISSHCHYEVARAHSFKPSYIACGPVYPTTTKDMPWVPQGVAGLNYWLKVLDYPLVAIGGINRERIEGIAATGVSGVAMITAITLAENPEQTTTDFIRQVEAGSCG